MKPLDLLEHVIGQQKSMEVIFEETTRAESYCIQLRRYKHRYPDMFSVVRRGSTVIVVPGNAVISTVIKGSPVVRPFGGNAIATTKALTHKQARIRGQILEEFYLGNQTADAAAGYLVDYEIADNLEDAHTILKESRDATYKPTA